MTAASNLTRPGEPSSYPTSTSIGPQKAIEAARDFLVGHMVLGEPNGWIDQQSLFSTSIVKPSAQASSFDLHRYATKRLADARSTGAIEASPTALSKMRLFLGTCIFDNGPTPQVGPSSDRTIEVHWLADGLLLTAIFDNDGETTILAVDADNRVLLDHDVEPDEEPSVELTAKVHDLLESMAKKVTVRPATFWG